MSGKGIEEDKTLDVSGLNCPLPVMKSKAALATMQAGQVLKVISTHPDSVKEFASLCRGPQFELADALEQEGRYSYWVRKLL